MWVFVTGLQVQCAPGTLAGLLNSAPELLDKLSVLETKLTMLLDDRNQNSVRHILANIDSLTSDLAAQGPQLRQTLQGVQVTVKQAGDAETMAGFAALCKTEGIIPALESSHAVAGAMKLGRELGPDAVILVNLSGRGDKDVATASAYFGV